MRTPMPMSTSTPQTLDAAAREVARRSDASLRHEELYSAFAVAPGVGRWRPFEYGIGQYVCGATQVASRLHTNVPRAGNVGLPQDWEMLVYGWRATASVPLDQPVLDWANETTVGLYHNEKLRAERRLIDLLLGQVRLVLPLALQMHLSYYVEVHTADRRVLADLEAWLYDRSPALNAALEALDCLAARRKVRNSPKLKRDVARAHDKVLHAQQARERLMLAWIHLGGLIYSPVC